MSSTGGSVTRQTTESATPQVRTAHARAQAVAALRHGRDRPVRVMHLVYTLRSGGMEHGVVKVVNGVDPARVASSICSTTPADQQMCALVSRDVPILELTRRSGNDPRTVWAIYRVLRQHRPDILHTHAWGTLLEGIIAARLARVPIVVHGEHGTLQLRRRQLSAQRWAWGHVDRLLSVSSRLAERMSREVGVPLDRVQVIRNGVDLTRFDGSAAPASRAIAVPGDGSVVVGAVGRLVDVKDHALFIDAVALLRQRGRRVLAVIAGDGPLRGELQDRVDRLGLRGIVRLLGHRGDVEGVFAALDVFALSSKSEGMSNTILEAMASGLPVVATQVGGADEMVREGETGLLVPPGDAERLADALDRLVSSASLRRAFGQAGRERAHGEFSLRHMVASYQSFYCDLFAADGGAAVGTIERHQ